MNKLKWVPLEEHRRQHPDEWPPGSRPQDTTLDGRLLSVRFLDRGGRFPRRVRVADPDGNACIYAALHSKIVDPTDRSRITFSFHDHAYLDAMPMTINASDDSNNTCTYVPPSLRRKRSL
jgi:hypothetical protein